MPPRSTTARVAKAESDVKELSDRLDVAEKAAASLTDFVVRMAMTLNAVIDLHREEKKARTARKMEAKAAILMKKQRKAQSQKAATTTTLSYAAGRNVPKVHTPRSQPIRDRVYRLRLEMHNTAASSHAISLPFSPIASCPALPPLPPLPVTPLFSRQELAAADAAIAAARAISVADPFDAFRL